MKSPKILLAITMFVSVFLLTACGKDDDSKAAISGPAAACQAGYGHSPSYGCIPQGYCPAGYGQYNNQCVPTNQGANACQAGAQGWNGNSCAPAGAGSGSCPYPGTYESTPGWCSCLPGLRAGANGCY